MSEVKISRDFEYRKMLLFFGILMMILSYISKNLLTLAIGFLLIFFYNYSIDIFLSKEGVVYVYKYFSRSKEKILPYKSLEEIVVLDKNVLILVSDVMAKNIIFDGKLRDEILEFFRFNRIKVRLE